MELIDGRICGTACAPRIDPASQPTLADNPAPTLASRSFTESMSDQASIVGFKNTTADEIAILSILRVLNQSCDPRPLTPVETAFIQAGHSLFAELAAVCERLLAGTRTLSQKPLEAPPKAAKVRKKSPMVE